MSNKVEVTPQSAGTVVPGAISTSQVIVLKEQDLDCDLATAIERIRANEDTSRSRILVVAADHGEDEVEEAVVEETPVVAPSTPSQAARRGQQLALERLGGSLEPLGACLQHYLQEMRAAVEQLSGELPAAAQAPLRTLQQALGWSDALASDLAAQTLAAGAGVTLVDPYDLMKDTAMEVEMAFPRLRVTLGAPVDQSCSGRPADLAEAFYLGLSLVAQRIGGLGAVSVDFEQRLGSLAIHISGQGEPTRDVSPDCVARFRKLVVDRHGGRVHHDRLGPGGAGLFLHLPTPA